ncbi:MAG: hypothetical protein ACK502_03940 [Alphaproteobacteria bacterium]
MDEIRFLNIASPSQNVKQPGIADSNSTNLPPIITRFPPGSILAGFVINRDAGGNPILRTENGDITFQTNLFLKIGTELVIRIENRSGHPQAHILTIDGEPPVTNEKGSVLQQPQNQPSQPSSTTSGNIPQQAAPTTRVPTEAANVSIQPTINATLTSDTPDVPAGSQFVIKVVSAEAPTQQTPSPNASAINPSYAAYARNSGNTVAPPTAPLQSAPANTAAAPIATGQIIQAVVTGSTQAGETILYTPSGATLQLSTTTPLVQGIKLTFEVGTIRPSGTAISQVINTEEPAPLAALARNWASLQQIYSLLGESIDASGITSLFGQPNVQAQSGAGINPQAISTGLLVFIAALRGGDFRGWLGRDNISKLEDQGHTSLIRKAEGEFLSLGKQFGDVQPGQWQTLFFPLAVHGQVEQVRFFLKRDKKQKNDRDNTTEDDTRFIVELDLSQMGELQLDGFIRKDPKTLEFDLYIRTRTQLDDATRQDIFTIYNEMAQLTGYKGQLAFQTVQEFPVRPLEETNMPHSDLNV